MGVYTMHSNIIHAHIPLIPTHMYIHKTFGEHGPGGSILRTVATAFGAQPDNQRYRDTFSHRTNESTSQRANEPTTPNVYVCIYICMYDHMYIIN